MTALVNLALTKTLVAKEVTKQASSFEGPRGLKGDSIKGDKGDSIKGDKGDSIKGDKGDSIKGDKGDSVVGLKGDKGDTIRGPKGLRGESVTGNRGLAGIKGDKGDKGNKGDTGVSVKSTKINPKGHLITTYTDGRKEDSGELPKGADGKVPLVYNAGGGQLPIKSPSGISELDFGLSSKTATVVVTGIGSITPTSVVLCKMRIEDTEDHIAEDLLIDPIRVEAFAIVAGVGFTIYGTMENAPANGKYKVQWLLG
jgi:hypothetical protein|tara:strand:+ start:974 stop:1738 length:765 start_codon:yes stop_codon:yes gene_type:complete